MENTCTSKNQEYDTEDFVEIVFLLDRGYKTKTKGSIVPQVLFYMIMVLKILCMFFSLVITVEYFGSKDITKLELI